MANKVSNKKGYFEIWRPRMYDRTVLLSVKYVLENDINIIDITRDETYNGEYIIHGSEITKCPVASNGKIDCYVVPLSKLTRSII